MSERTCGTCTACCKIMAIDELEKPASVWCHHCEIAKGCKIYESRPDSCRKFKCLWLTDPRLPDSMRPDKTKAVFHVEKDKGRLKVNVDPDRPDAWKVGLTKQYIDLVRTAGVDVLIVCGLKKNLRTEYARTTEAHRSRNIVSMKWRRNMVSRGERSSVGSRAESLNR